MRMTNWMRAGTMAALGLVTWVGGAHAQRDDARGDAPRAAGEARDQGERRDQGETRNQGQRRAIPNPIDSPQDLQDTARLVFLAADANRDGQISRKEAVDAANLFVGGFFFRADADGNGTLTQEEARQARQEFLNRQPILRVFAQEARRQRGGDQGGQGGTRQNPLRSAADLLDENNDRQLQASEVRQAVQGAVDGFYESADTNRDDQLSPSELNAAAIGMARAAVQAAFQLADADNSGSLSREEFERAVLEPARTVFSVLDGDNNNQISPQEARQAQRMLMNQMRVRIPDTRGERAPVPDFGAQDGDQPRRGQPGQPRPGQRRQGQGGQDRDQPGQGQSGEGQRQPQ